MKIVKRLVGVVAPDRSDIASVSYALARRVGTLCSFRQRQRHARRRDLVLQADLASGDGEGLLARDPLEAARRRALACVLARDGRSGQRRVAVRVADVLHRRPVIAAALAATALLTSTPPPVDRAAGRRGAMFLAAQQPGNELGVEADTVLALVAAGIAPGLTSRDSARWCPTDAGPRTGGEGGARRGGGGREPRCFAGVDLVARIRSGYGDGIYGATVFDDSLAIEALAGADEPVPCRTDRAAAPAGQGGYGLSLTGGGSDDADTTGLALMALRAAGAPRSDPAVRGAVRWLLARRLPGAGWAGAAGTSTVSNSTGLALRGLSAAGVGWPSGAAPRSASSRAADGGFDAAGGGSRQPPAGDARLGAGAVRAAAAARPAGDTRARLQVAILIRAGQATAGVPATGGSRKVRTPKGRVLGNSQAGKPDGKCNRKDTAEATRKGRR